MAKLLSHIDPALAEWLIAQPLFFVASAPLAADGHVNLSPRGLDSFRVLGGHEVVWLDRFGSGNETAAHLLENGRITLMFCAFEGEPRIIRLYGRGTVLLPQSAEFALLRPLFPAQPEPVRQIVRVAVERIQSSCGFGVPQMTLDAQRDELLAWHRRKGDEGLERYHREKNSHSIDGLPAPLPK